MSGPDEKDPLGFEDLADELDAWDDMFDALHESAEEPSRPQAETAPPPAAEPEPEPEPAAPRSRLGAETAPGGLYEPSSEMEIELDDPRDEITSAPIGADITIEVGDPFTNPFDDPFTNDDDADEFFAELELEAPPRALGSLLGDRASAELPVPTPPPRRGPAIVRREDLDRDRFGEVDELEEDAAAEWEVAPITNVMAKATVDRMVETAAAFFDEEDEGEVELELDGDFYDDIAIDDSQATELPRPPEPVPERAESRAVRRTMAHVVRRAPSVADVAPEQLEPSQDEIVVELEAEIEGALEDLRPRRRRGMTPPLNKSQLEALLLGDPPPGFEPVARPAEPQPEPQPAPTEGEGARALEAGDLSPTSLPDVELPPDLPPPIVGRELPGLEDLALELPERLEEVPDDRTDERVLHLEWALAAMDGQAPGPARARLALWAADLSDDLGDLDEAERLARVAIEEGGGALASAATPLLRRLCARRADWHELCELFDQGVESSGEREAAALATLAIDLRASLGVDLGDRGAAGDIAAEWRGLLAATGDGDPAALAAAAPAMARQIADAPLRATLARAWVRAAGTEVWSEAGDLAPELGADLVAWELAASGDQSARADAAEAVAAALEEAGDHDVADSFCIVAAEARRAAGDAAAARALLERAAERHGGHPTILRLLLSLLGPEDREEAGFLLATVSGTALAPEAARALRRWAQEDSGAARVERLHRALALYPADPLVRLEIAAATGQLKESSEGGEPAMEIEVGLALAPEVTGDPVLAIERARQARRAGDADAARAALEGGELPRGELLVAAELVDLAGSEGEAEAWGERRGDASNMTRRVLERRALLASPAPRDPAAFAMFAADGDRFAARAAVAAAADGEAAELWQVAGDWPGLEAAPIALHRIAGEIADGRLDEAAAASATEIGEEPGDARLEWLAVAGLARGGDWELAADRLAAAAGEGAAEAAARYRAAYLLLEHAGDATAAEAIAQELATARPDFAGGVELLAAARRKLGGEGVEVARPVPVRPRGADPRAAAVRAAESCERAGDASRAIALYQELLEERPEDPIALFGLEWAAREALESEPLAERAIAALRRAEEERDPGARADAYENLARIDQEITGDPASAVLAWESAADTDPTRLAALRVLERAYVAGVRHRDLLKLYGRLLAVTEGPRETAALLMARARCADLAERERGEVLASYRQVLELEPRERMALFHLEAQARLGEPSPERAALEKQVAELLSSDDRSEAAFLCRSGETLATLRDHAAAIERFKEGVAACTGHIPSIRGWREAARRAEIWPELAAAAEAEGQAQSDDAAAAELLHLAGVTWMDRAGDGEEARRLLGAALARQPEHGDAFTRLRVLYDEVGDDESLGDLYRARLEAGAAPDLELALHLELAHLCRNFWEDREGARRHLRAALQIAPQNRTAIAGLSDLAWEMGAWEEASEILIRRAKLETDETVLKHIFYRLGTIYADHLPDSRWAQRCFRKVLKYDPDDIPALERLALLAASGGDFKTALAAYEKLLKLEVTSEDKVRYLHHVAEIQERGLGQPAGAERALRAAFDLAPDSEAALKELVGFYRRAGDVTSIRVNLDRAAQAMRARLVGDPAAPAPYAVLARVLATREAAGVRGSAPVAACAAEIAAALGEAPGEVREIVASRPPGRPNLEALATSEADDLVTPRMLPVGLRVLLSRLRGRVPKYVNADVKRFGVGRGERLRRGKHPVADLAREMAAELGLGGAEVYLDSANPRRLAVVPGSPPALVLGPELATLDRAGELAFALGRCLKLAQTGTSVIDVLSPPELDLFIAGLITQFVPDFVGFNLEEGQLEAERHRLRRLVPGSMADDLRPHAQALTGVLLEPGALHRGMRQLGLRAGLIASGDAEAALAAAVKSGGYSTSQEAARDPDIAGLLRFAISEEHVELQALLGA